MSASIAPSRPASLSASSVSSSAHTIHGVAIGAGDVTRGKSRTRKLWPAETLRQAATSLAGRPLVRDHRNDTRGSVGRVIDAKYKDGIGVLYRADLFDDELARKIENGQLEVSPRIVHDPSEELDRDTDADALVVDRAVFDNLSLVLSGAAKSNTVEYGDSEELTGEEIAEEFGVEELSETEASRARDLRDSLGWYQKQRRRSGGWASQIEHCEEELTELVGTADTDELNERLGTDEEPAGLTDREKAIEECQERIGWYTDHHWDGAAELERDRLADLEG